MMGHGVQPASRPAARYAGSVDENQGPHLVGMALGIFRGHPAAHRMSDDRFAPDSQGTQNGMHEGNHACAAIVARYRGTSEPVPGLVDPDHTIILRQRSEE